MKENKEHYIRNALEAGAQGVVIPHIATKEAAEKAVQYARFPLRVFGAPIQRFDPQNTDVEILTGKSL